MHTRPVWAEVSRAHLIANYLELRHRAGSAGMLAVVKANAYGHGLEYCAHAFVSAGAAWLGVTSVEEGIRARIVAPESQILVMSGIWQGEAEAALKHRLTPLVWEGYHLDLLSEAARKMRRPPRSVPVHLEVDTGMSRQGLSPRPASLDGFLTALHAGPALYLDGVATHFSAPESFEDAANAEQLARFDAALAHLAATGLSPAWVHVGNSATLLRGDQLEALQRTAARIGAGLMLRPGLSLYGYAPRFVGDAGATAIQDAGARLHPALAWKSRVTSLRTIQAGEGAGYNSTFRATRPTRLALLPIGYADGLNRLLSNRGSVLVRGQRAPIAGRISMDQTILDVTAIPGVEIGEEAVILGRQGEDTITADEIGRLTGTIPYEVLCAISARVPRILIE